MAINTLRILQVDGVDIPGTNTAPIMPPSPWSISGDITIDAGSVESMAYQVNEGALVGFDAPSDVGAGTYPYSFSLSATDLPFNGIYLLTVYAWDNGTDSATQTANLSLTNVIGQPVGDCTCGALE